VKRPSQHVMESEAEQLIKRLLPSEWIVHDIQHDYGIDFEVEVVKDELVTGDRVWIQSKAVKECKIKKFYCDASGISGVNHESSYANSIGLVNGEAYAEYIPFSVKRNLLTYALRCPLPILLFICCLDSEDVFWVPLRIAALSRLNDSNRDLSKQRDISLKVPIWSSLKSANTDNFYSLRWFAEDLSRVSALATLGYIIDKVSSTTGINFSTDYISRLAIQPSIDVVEELDVMVTAIEQIKGLHILYGERGLQSDDTVLQIDHICEQASKTIKDIRGGKSVSKNELNDSFHRCVMAIMILASSSSLYYDFEFTHILNQDSLLMRLLSH